MRRFVVIGLGNFGSSVAEALHAARHDVLAVDTNAAAVDRIAPFVARAVVTDGRSAKALERVGAKGADGGIVSTGDDITASILAALALRDLAQAAEPARVRIDDILKVVGRHYNVARADLLSPRRAQSIVRPRQVGMYLAKKLTSRSLPEIGRRFGGRDHSTVLHAVRKIEELMQSDDRLAREVALLMRLIEHQ
jgi:chromosomal replication initiator protein